MVNKTDLFTSEAMQQMIESQMRFQKLVDGVTKSIQRLNEPSRRLSNIISANFQAVRLFEADFVRLSEQTRSYSEAIRQSGLLQQFEQSAEAINAFQRSSEQMAIARSLYEYVNSSLDFVGNLDLDIRNKISDIALQEDIVDDSAPIEPIDTRQIEPELMEQAQQLFPKLQKLTFDQVITIIGILLTICNLLYMDAQTKQVHVDAVQQHEDSVQAHADAERAHQDFLDSLNQSTKVDTKIKTTPENPR